MTPEQAAFVSNKGFSCSKLLQKRINDLMTGQVDGDYWQTRAQLMALKLDEAMKFIEKEGLSDVFSEEVGSRKQSKIKIN